MGDLAAHFPGERGKFFICSSGDAEDRATQFRQSMPQGFLSSRTGLLQDGGEFCGGFSYARFDVLQKRLCLPRRRLKNRLLPPAEQKIPELGRGVACGQFPGSLLVECRALLSPGGISQARGTGQQNQGPDFFGVKDCGGQGDARSE